MNVGKLMVCACGEQIEVRDSFDFCFELCGVCFAADRGGVEGGVCGTRFSADRGGAEGLLIEASPNCTWSAMILNSSTVSFLHLESKFAIRNRKSDFESP